MSFLTVESHIVTMKVLGENNLKDYLKKYISDINAWEAYFSISDLEHRKKLKFAFNILPTKLVVRCAGRFAENVLSIYESKYPDDNRPRKAVELVLSQKFSSVDAADASAASVDAANAAYYAAASSPSAAYYAASASSAAAYAASSPSAAYAASSASAAAYYAAYAASSPSAAYAASSASAAAYYAASTDAYYDPKCRDIHKKQADIVLKVISQGVKE